jgi:hypothetical protein
MKFETKAVINTLIATILVATSFDQGERKEEKWKMLTRERVKKQQLSLRNFILKVSSF